MKTEKQDQYIVRFPKGMRDAIKAVAAANHRSMNAEIIYRLSQAYNENEKGAEPITA
ncbi:Arc family DNA-binding protein [Agrobacterium salinitolerans]